MSALARYWSLTKVTFRFDGLPVLLWRLVRRAVAPLGSLEIHFVYDKDLRLDVPQVPVPDDIAIRVAVPDEAEAVVAIEFGAEEPIGERRDDPDGSLRTRLAAQARARMTGGDTCFVATAGGAIVHFSWVRSGELPPVLGMPVPLAAGECYLTDAYTVRRWRGYRLFDAVSQAALLHAKQVGFVTAFCMADFLKAPSRRMVGRHGWRLRGRALVFRPWYRERGSVVRLGGRVDPFFRSLW